MPTPTAQWLLDEGTGQTAAGTGNTPDMTTTETSDLWQQRGGITGIQGNRAWTGPMGAGTSSVVLHTTIVRAWIDNHGYRHRLAGSPQRTTDGNFIGWEISTDGELSTWRGGFDYSGGAVPTGQWCWLSINSPGANDTGLVTINGQATPDGNSRRFPVTEDTPVQWGWQDSIDTDSGLTISHVAWFDHPLDLGQIQDYTAAHDHDPEPPPAPVAYVGDRPVVASYLGAQPVTLKT